MFEYKFPFYRMDVNGFTFLVRQASHSQCPEHETPHEIKVVSLKALQLAFSNHAYWNDINNEKSELCQFILEVCKPDEDEILICDYHGQQNPPEENGKKTEEEDGVTPGASGVTQDMTLDGDKVTTPGAPACNHEHKNLLSIFKLHILGVLWCLGEPIEKA